MNDSMVMRAKGALHDHEESNSEESVLAGRPALVGSGAAFANKTDRAETQGRPADHEWDHPCSAIGLPLAGLPAGIRAIDHGL